MGRPGEGRDPYAEASEKARQIIPISIILLDKPYFPVAPPILQLFLSHNRLSGRSKSLDVNQTMNLVFFDEF
jgi:hypothetical protein